MRRVLSFVRSLAVAVAGLPLAWLLPGCSFNASFTPHYAWVSYELTATVRDVTTGGERPLSFPDLAIDPTAVGPFQFPDDRIDPGAADQAALDWWKRYLRQRLGTGWCVADARIARVGQSVRTTDDPAPSIDGELIETCPDPDPPACGVGVGGTGRLIVTPDALRGWETPVEIPSDEVRTITLTNEGPAPLCLAWSGLGGAHPDDFAVATDCVVDPAAGRVRLDVSASCNLRVTFTPLDRATRRAEIVLDSNDAEARLRVVPLEGRGIGGTLLVPEGNGLDNSHICAPPAGDGSYSRMVTLRNTGPGFVRLRSWTVSPGWTLDMLSPPPSGSGWRLAPTESVTARVRHIPPAVESIPSMSVGGNQENWNFLMWLNAQTSPSVCSTAPPAP